MGVGVGAPTRRGGHGHKSRMMHTPMNIAGVCVAVASREGVGGPPVALHTRTPTIPF